MFTIADAIGVTAIAASALVLVLALGTVMVLMIRPWIRGYLGGVPLTIPQILAMRIHGVPPNSVIDELTELRREGRRIHAEDVVAVLADLYRSPVNPNCLSDAIAESFNRRKALEDRSSVAELELPAPATVLTVGGQALAIPVAPLDVGTWVQMVLPPRAIVRGEQMVLQFNRGFRRFGALLLLIGFLQLAVGIVGTTQAWSMLMSSLLAVTGSILMLVGILILLLRSEHQFDKPAGEYRRVSWLNSRSTDLSLVVGVQLIPGRRVSVDGESGSKVTWQSYQLNLILQRSSLERVPLFCGTHLPSTAEVARQLSEFLGIPLV